MARLLADENFPFPVTQELRVLGHDVMTLNELGKADQGFTDEAVLRLARSEDRAVLTLNRKHFVRLHREGREHAGIFACTFDVDFAGQARRIAKAIAGADRLVGELFRINRPG